MADGIQLTKAMRRNAIDAMESTKPVNVCFGTVVSSSPLKIDVEQRMVLGEGQLILTRNVTEYTTMVTVQWQTELEEIRHKHQMKNITSANTEYQEVSHKHDIEGTKQMTIHNALEKGEQVILIRQQEGQKFIVLDRIG